MVSHFEYTRYTGAVCARLLWTNMTSSTKPEVHNVLQCRQRRRAKATRNMNRKFCDVWNHGLFATVYHLQSSSTVDRLHGKLTISRMRSSSQNFISISLVPNLPISQRSCQYIHNFLSYPMNKRTDTRQNPQQKWLK